MKTASFYLDLLHQYGVLKQCSFFIHPVYLFVYEFFVILRIIHHINYCVLNCGLQGLVFEQFTVNMLNLMRSILRCEAYTPAKTLEGRISQLLIMPRSVIC